MKQDFIWNICCVIQIMQPLQNPLLCSSTLNRLSVVHVVSLVYQFASALLVQCSRRGNKWENPTPSLLPSFSFRSTLHMEWSQIRRQKKIRLLPLNPLYKCGPSNPFLKFNRLALQYFKAVRPLHPLFTPKIELSPWEWGLHNSV
jgi:hypothetical protein